MPAGPGDHVASQQSLCSSLHKKQQQHWLLVLHRAVCLARHMDAPSELSTGGMGCRCWDSRQWLKERAVCFEEDASTHKVERDSWSQTVTKNQLSCLDNHATATCVFQRMVIFSSF